MVHLDLKQRFKIALGGFLFFTGFVLLVFTIMIITKKIDVETISSSEFQRTIVVAVLVMGSLDVLAAILLIRSR